MDAHHRAALYDRCATLLATGPVAALPHLSLQPQRRRQRGSWYDAIAAGAVSAAHLEARTAA